ncbi:transcription elongation factor SPT4-like isoform X3 [Coccinella septempunctata]|uniref:transcription elongation factor SPT4-like isoform X3 n=1 Tax=Coccinella septempunctata TaxID=41139 RepID=UPI001D099E56|nr:transcription elongation factor SPT4-like isoform X3 [Coccinella septempunctata]
MSLDTIPVDLRRLRACLACSLIKSFEQFLRDGCDNCEEFLRMRKDSDNVYLYTSKSFTGMAAMMQPSESWVGKWLRIGVCCPGMYALSVAGSLPREKMRQMRRLGLFCGNRDRSQ